jgi:hypothetical protein
MAERAGTTNDNPIWLIGAARARLTEYRFLGIDSWAP